tara:strand:- start:57 stop:215 length:159 start_codon:yes stop_codon:yes gene_type:complete
MFTTYDAIMFEILLITGSASIIQMSEEETRLRKNQPKDFKIKIRFGQLLNYF